MPSLDSHMDLLLTEEQEELPETFNILVSTLWALKLQIKTETQLKVSSQSLSLVQLKLN